MKLIRPFLVIAVLAASIAATGTAFAGSGCPDDPERCVERGASLTHRSVSVAPATIATATSTPVRVAPAKVTPKAGTPVAAPATTKKSASKPARTPSTPAPATPGMGMLLKLSNGSGGEVSLFPSKPNDTTTGASWVL